MSLLFNARHVDGETTNGHWSKFFLQTLMKDARQGLHSLVETQTDFCVC
jgi:hypothetical protein